jgi:hypothetical protein
MFRRSVTDFGGEMCAMKLVVRNPLCPAVLKSFTVQILGSGAIESLYQKQGSYIRR